MSETYAVYGVVMDVHDGDTLTVDLDLGWWVTRRTAKIRVLDLWCPELNVPAGIAARDRARELLPIGTRVRIVSALKPTFDRTLATVEIVEFPGVGMFAELMIAGGFGTATRTG